VQESNHAQRFQPTAGRYRPISIVTDNVAGGRQISSLQASKVSSAWPVRHEGERRASIHRVEAGTL